MSSLYNTAAFSNRVSDVRFQYEYITDSIIGLSQIVDEILRSQPPNPKRHITENRLHVELTPPQIVKE
jgi:hypothetical protein